MEKGWTDSHHCTESVWTIFSWMKSPSTIRFLSWFILVHSFLVFFFFDKKRKEGKQKFFMYLSIILPMSISLPGVNSYIGNRVSSEICYNSFYEHVIAFPFRCDRVAFFHLWKRTKKRIRIVQKNPPKLLTFMRIFSIERSKDGGFGRTRWLSTVDRIDEGGDSKSVR